MGNLIRIPHSELHATLEVLEHLGVEPGDFARIRRHDWQANLVVRTIQSNREGPASLEAQLEEWECLYQGLFDVVGSTGGIVIPRRESGFNWLVVVDPAIRMNRIFEAWIRLFKSDWDGSRPHAFSLRSRSKPYVLWVRDRVEAGEEPGKLSVDEVLARSIETMDLRERALLEIVYYRRTGEHLDLEDWTLCPLSRNPQGEVASVGVNKVFDTVTIVAHPPDWKGRVRQAIL